MILWNVEIFVDDIYDHLNLQGDRVTLSVPMTSMTSTCTTLWWQVRHYFIANLDGTTDVRALLEGDLERQTTTAHHSDRIALVLRWQRPRGKWHLLLFSVICEVTYSDYDDEEWRRSTMMRSSWVEASERIYTWLEGVNSLIKFCTSSNTRKMVSTQGDPNSHYFASQE